MHGNESNQNQEPSQPQRSSDDRSIREDERRLATLLSNLPGMAYRCGNDANWTMEFVSDGCEVLTGFKPADLLGNSSCSYNSLIHPDDRDRVWDEVQQAVRRRTPFRLTYRIRAADGREKWVSEQGVGIFAGEQLEALEGFITDITGRKKAEARLQSQNRRFRRIIENTDAGYFRIGLDGCYEDVNPAWLRMHGFNHKEQIIGRPLSVVQVAEDAHKAEAIAKALMRGESVTGSEFSRLRRDGTVGHHTFSANPILEDDKVIGIEGFLIDITERRQAEEERRQIEQRYRVLFDAMNEGVALHTLVYSQGIAEDYRLLDVNTRYEEIIGVKRAQVVNKLATEAYGTKEPPYLKEYASVVQTGRALQFETYFPPMRKHFVISVAHVGGDLFATIFFDITEQKRTQLHYALISENAADVIFLFDPAEQRCVYVSPSVKKLRGFSPEEIVAQSLEESMPPHSYQMVIGELQRRTSAFESGDETARIGTNDIEFFRKDGTTVATETVTTLVADDQGAVRQVIGVSRDITGRKRMEDALRQSEEKFAKAFLHGPAVTMLADLADGDRLIEVNEAFMRFLGYRRDEVVGRTTAELGVWADPDEYAEIKRRIQNNEKVRNFEVHFRRKNGEIAAGLVSAEAIELNGRECLIATTLDITERKAAELEKAKLEEQLRQAQKMESVGRLAGGVAHDFNNLLTVINGYSQMLSREFNPRDPRREMMEEIYQAGERAAGLTRQLLAFSRKQDLRPQFFDLNGVVGGMRSLLSRLMGEDVEVRMDLNAASAHVYADPHQLEQVVMNLAVNARDAMPEGGTMSIRTSEVTLDADDSPKRLGVPPGSHVLLAVSDDGGGMDEETRQRIFEPFFTTKGQGKGTGLGLSVVQGVVEQSGGRIEVETEVGKGSTFNIYLPLATGSVAAEEASEPARALGGEETVLVVEDQREVLTLTARVLIDYGYRVLTAEDADSALALCDREQGRIHLLLTDVIMPKVDGRELARRMEWRRPGIKVLFMSGYTGEAIEHRGLLDVETQLLQKPFSPDGLAAKVREVLGKPQPHGRILVTDDEAAVRGFVRSVLASAGYEVIEAADGKQALMHVHAGKVDLVIMDLIMPEQEGIETIQALRREAPSIGIIAISGAFGGQFLKAARILGADAALHKPLSAELLLIRVAEVLKLSR